MPFVLAVVAEPGVFVTIGMLLPVLPLYAEGAARRRERREGALSSSRSRAARRSPPVPTWASPSTRLRSVESRPPGGYDAVFLVGALSSVSGAFLLARLPSLGRVQPAEAS
jgi:hypothetical protein